MSRRSAFVAAMAAYLVPSFVVAVIWHLQAFKPYYDQLEIYREDVLIPLGLASMLIQAAIFAAWYAHQRPTGGVVASGLRFALRAGSLAWSYTVLPVAAKFPMTSIGGFMLIETGFTVVQWALVGPLIALAWSRTKEPWSRTEEA